MTGEPDRDGAGEAPQADDHGPELDVDTAFAALVAQFSAPVSETAHPWPAAEDLGLDDVKAVSLADEPPSLSVRGQIDPPAIVEEPTAEEDPGYLSELDEHFVPPEPPPLPRGDLVSRLAWAGVIGGPLFLLVAAMIGGDLPAALLLVALGAFIGGFVTLVARMPGEPPDDSDNGAVV